MIQVRQKITGFEATKRQNGDPACAILIETEHIRTEPKSFRAFQGWRYLPLKKHPLILQKYLITVLTFQQIWPLNCVI